MLQAFRGRSDVDTEQSQGLKRTRIVPRHHFQSRGQREWTCHVDGSCTGALGIDSRPLAKGLPLAAPIQIMPLIQEDSVHHLLAATERAESETSRAAEQKVRRTATMHPATQHRSECHQRRRQHHPRGPPHAHRKVQSFKIRPRRCFASSIKSLMEFN